MDSVEDHDDESDLTAENGDEPARSSAFNRNVNYELVLPEFRRLANEMQASARRVSKALEASPDFRRLVAGVAEQNKRFATEFAESQALNRDFRQLATQLKDLNASMKPMRESLASSLERAQEIPDTNHRARQIAANLATSADWERFSAALAVQTADIDIEGSTESDLDELDPSVVSTIEQADDLLALVGTEGELEEYDLSASLSGHGQYAVKSVVAILVFVQTFSWVVDNYDFGSELNTLTGFGPLLAAQIAWSLTGKLLQQLEEVSDSED